MTQLTAEHGEPITPAIRAHPAMRRDNIYLPEGASARWSNLFLGVGAVGLGLTVVGALTLGEHGLRHALASYLVGVASVTAVSLGALFYVMAMHLTQAGWSVSLRRQLENLMAMLPVCVLMILPLAAIELWNRGVLYAWMDASHAHAGDVLLKKRAYLNPTFFTLRLVVYAAVWVYLARRLWWYSTEQDRTADRWLTNRARRTSSWGMLAFALTTAFAAFDLLMSLDYGFYSTMWGVYYFAGCAFSATAFIVLILTALRSMGRLDGAVTDEHFHDLGKFCFAFTVFWAYIAFSQYFLIWYSNIPEETAYFLYRKTGQWEIVSTILAVGHFGLPFYILLWRRVRRTPALLAVVAVWMMLVQVLDLFWVVRPMVYAGEPGGKIGLSGLWVDLAAVAGCFGIYLGILWRRIASGPLVPLNDPRMSESLHHRNYV